MPKEKSKPEEKKEEAPEEKVKSASKKKLRVFSFPKHGVSFEAEDLKSAVKQLESLTPESDG